MTAFVPPSFASSDSPQIVFCLRQTKQMYCHRPRSLPTPPSWHNFLKTSGLTFSVNSLSPWMLPIHHPPTSFPLDLYLLINWFLHILFYLFKCISKYPILDCKLFEVRDDIDKDFKSSKLHNGRQIKFKRYGPSHNVLTSHCVCAVYSQEAFYWSCLCILNS